VTNGLGGFACGTAAGANTRRYHGFLMASLSPPVQRTLLVAKVELSVRYLGVESELSANEFAGGAVSGTGFVRLESFSIVDGIPTWRYAVADALIEQRIFMAPGSNTSYLRLELLRASAPMRATLKPLVTYRDYHSQNRGATEFQVDGTQARECRIQAFSGARPYRLSISEGSFIAAPAWYWNFWHRLEADRGLDAVEDLLTPGSFTADLSPHRPVFLLATAESAAPAPGDDVLDVLRTKTRRLSESVPAVSPAWIRDLAIASDQFIVKREFAAPRGAALAASGVKAAVPAGVSIIAGYPWFADWGRDTMISLPGLATSLGRHDLAAGILRTFAGFIDGGMLPNNFPDAGETPQYNTADATLWMFQALDDHLAAKPDPDLVHDLFPSLMNVVHAHAAGTRYGIRVDPVDGLLHAGEAGTQLTWMDAKHGDDVFTPRIGKPVEINALWLNALSVAARLAAEVGNNAEKDFCQSLLSRAASNFKRFWNEQRGCLYDVIDVDGGGPPDGRIRPNQLFAVSLPYPALTDEQMRAVVDCCGRELLTSHGLRTLSPNDPGYVGRYVGDAAQRDAAYHMGTVWAWLLGPFARAHFRVYGDARLAQSFLAPMQQHLHGACVGSLSEIFDGDAPHTARGCFAQAWSVAEILRSWLYLESTLSAT
jgi:predicted glycogen debranching enzyme